MRVRTDEKRQAIMEAAEAVFREVGYERASMSAIAARVGGSKQTLYSYFQSKDDLFSAVMVEAMDEQAELLLALLHGGDGDLRATLEAFADAYVDFILSPEVLTLTRVAVTEGGKGTLGARLYELGPLRGWAEMAATLTRWAGENRLRIDDPTFAAFHLKALLEAGLFEPALFGAPPPVDRRAAARAAVAAFLRAYAPSVEGP
ncbi:TetR/AcrR family transcriptional regulator [Phenylobacterium sp.]|uniref:TetR/AcrR family transcriptional regulator n=1 Tax=Phenylobacterium sp. TaxID=1871053 RepID=UPI0039188685